jgi:hypothetical protein
MERISCSGRHSGLDPQPIGRSSVCNLAANRYRKNYMGPVVILAFFLSRGSWGTGLQS